MEGCLKAIHFRLIWVSLGCPPSPPWPPGTSTERITKACGWREKWCKTTWPPVQRGEQNSSSNAKEGVFVLFCWLKKIFWGGGWVMGKNPEGLMRCVPTPTSLTASFLASPRSGHPTTLAFALDLWLPSSPLPWGLNMHFVNSSF